MKRSFAITLVAFSLLAIFAVGVGASNAAEKKFSLVIRGSRGSIRAGDLNTTLYYATHKKAPN